MIRVSSQIPTVGQNVSTANITAVEIVHTDAKECYSVCLYKEPLYKQLHPTRDFKQRYLEPFKDDVRNHLEKHKMALNIFCDEESLELAISLKTGSVYLVTQKPLYPFFQHLYRYYSVFLEHPTIQTYHFRGMDNIVADDTAVSRLREFHNSSMDVLNMPYFRNFTSKYCPIRGSCSISRRGIKSLAGFLKHKRLYPDVTNKRLLWHSDEDFLTEWFNGIKNTLGIYTIVDRELPMDFYFDLMNMTKSGANFIITNAERGVI